MQVELTETSVKNVFLEMLKETALIVGPIMLVALIAGIIANYFQVGFLFAPESIQVEIRKSRSNQRF